MKTFGRERPPADKRRSNSRNRSLTSRDGGRGQSQRLFGTTFVELIKRQGTRLGVKVQGSLVDKGKRAAFAAQTIKKRSVSSHKWFVNVNAGLEPRIAELVDGSWAQRSDVLCVGDSVISINGASTAAMTQGDIVQVRRSALN